MEDFALAMQIYAKLEKSRGAIDREAEDIASNYSAARAQRTWTIGIGDVRKHGSGESYEVCFNLAYELAALGKLAEAEEALNHAQSTKLSFQNF
jgi:hypothetical protein